MAARQWQAGIRQTNGKPSCCCCYLVSANDDEPMASSALSCSLSQFSVGSAIQSYWLQCRCCRERNRKRERERDMPTTAAEADELDCLVVV